MKAAEWVSLCRRCVGCFKCVIGRFVLKLLKYPDIPAVPVAFFDLDELELLGKFLLAEWPGAIQDEVLYKSRLGQASVPLCPDLHESEDPLTNAMCPHVASPALSPSGHHWS